jgi:hypothetical protein
LTAALSIVSMHVFARRVATTGAKASIREVVAPNDPAIRLGAFSLFTDIEGRMMGLWKAAKKSCAAIS